MSYSSYLYNVGYGYKNTKNQGWDLTGFTDCLRSTGDRQNTDRQVADLKAYAEYRQLEVTSIFEEKISGAKKNSERPVLVEATTGIRT